MSMYAVEEMGGAIWGVGRTPDDAVAEANRWLEHFGDKVQASELSDRYPEGAKYRLIRATPTLALQVKNDGSVSEYGYLPDGTACTEEEERAAKR